MLDRRVSWLACALLICSPAAAQMVTVTSPGQNVEHELPTDEPPDIWARNPAAISKVAGDKLVKRAVTGNTMVTVKLKNVIPPIRYGSGVAAIPGRYVELLRRALAKLRNRRNVRVHLVGYADSQPLSPALVRIYGNNAGLSRERAGQIAEYLKRKLSLPPSAISYAWAGDKDPIASNDTPAGRALNRRVEVEVWYDRPKERIEMRDAVIKSPIRQVEVCRIQTLCMLRFKEGQEHRTWLEHLVPPLHYQNEGAHVPRAFIEQIRKALANLSDKRHVVVKFIGYTDNLPLTGRDKRIYGNHVALSKARAERVALAVQGALHLPSSAVAVGGRGASRPVASNDSAEGRAANRRIQVQFWYDDPLHVLPNQPQLCPKPQGSQVVTKVYHPPWGHIPPLKIMNGKPVIPAGYADLLRRAMADVRGKRNVRLRFVGYTANKRLDRRTALVYGDDIGLSASRARRAMDAIRKQMHLSRSQVEHEGRGYVQSPDVVNAGFTQGQKSYVVVQVVYDKLAYLDDYGDMNILRLTRQQPPDNPFALNLMHITVDGKPVDDPKRSSADIQRCTDVALDKADIQFQFDDLKTRPRLSVSVSPGAVVIHKSKDGSLRAQPVRFRMYTNFSSFIEHAQIRIFRATDSTRGKPLAVVAVNSRGIANWQPAARPVSSAGRELRYVLRAYGKDGGYDETVPQSLWMIRDDAAPPARPRQDELLAGYGESDIAVHNVALTGGTVTVRGSGVPRNHTVWVAGHEVPVDRHGRFVAQEILPTGTQTVEVAVLGKKGKGRLYLRDIDFKRRDLFYVGMADLTVSKTDTSGAANLLQGANPPFNYNSTVDGSLSFFAREKFDDHWRVTASADTREGPVKDLFSNFMSKSPDALFRRLDPDYYYPTYGDDSVVEEAAPTLGKLYVKVQHRHDYAMWGDFNVDYAQNELAQVDRGLYGADGHWQSKATTSFGDTRLSVDGFAAEPGTVSSREEFRGTGGSLYFLHHQDILTGSERVWIELRDKDSGLVTGTVNLQPGIDYQIDYLQGRILLAQPLSAVAQDNMLVRTSGLSGDYAYLAVRYEYTPGFQNVTTFDTGGQAHYWVNNHVEIGLSDSNSSQGNGSSLRGADLTLRKSTHTWLRLQAARSEGLVSDTLSSSDGGFQFTSVGGASFSNASADSYRADLSVGLGDFFKGRKGRMTVYTQNMQPGFSSPGFSALTRQRYYGGTFEMPIGKSLNVRAKADSRSQEFGLETQAEEMDVRYHLTEKWTVSTGVRRDTRTDHSPAVPLSQVQGERTDGVVQVGFDPHTSWRVYTFVQDSLSRTGNRATNGRAGVGGSYRLSKKLRVTAEASDGDLGVGGRLGTSYLYSNRTTLYLNYSLENERDINGVLDRQGNLISGVKRRLSDSSSVYVEERYQQTQFMSGLTHNAGVNLTVADHWSVAANAEVGTLQDPQTAAKTKRRAGSLRVSYDLRSVEVSSGVEYLSDGAEQPDLTMTTMKTWLFRNNFKYQITPSWRLVGKLDHSMSRSSQGQFYDGGFTEGVIGYGYRPVENDRLNVLAKYTYFYNVPSTGQVTLQGTAAQFIQKSHIASVDVTYDLTPRWTIGGKDAYRLGELSLTRNHPQFFENPAQLCIVRVDWHVARQWEGMIEGRVLNLPDLKQWRGGALVGIFRHIGRHVKVGIGYNFTDFSDDLTDMSFKSRGVFLNVVGAM